MTHYTIWHNPRCSKSRQTLTLLQQHGVEPEVRFYLDNPPDPAELERVLSQLALQPADLIRKGEQTFKNLGLNINAPQAELIRAMSDNPILIERPVVICSGKEKTRAVLGRPPENVMALLD